MSEKQRTILLCEDSEFLNRAIRDYLRGKGHIVLATADGESAWEAIQESRPDALVSDYELPGLSGLDLLALVNASGLNVPVIFMTSAGTERVAAEALNLGAGSYLIKGRKDDTLRAIHRALRKVFYQLDLEEENRELVEKLQRQNDELERLVAERTTDLQRAVEDLRCVDKLKSDFMTLVSHEMRTPVASILGFSDILRQGLYSDSEELDEIHGHLYQAGMRLSEFINDSIELFQWLSGRRQLTIDEVNIEQLVRYSVDGLMRCAEGKRVCVRVDIPDDLVIEADRGVLEQAVLRVFDNSVKYSHEAGDVRICGEHQGDHVVLRFIDEGVGIDRDRVRSIFRPLEVCGDLNHHHEGQGLSLPLVKEAVEAHGGEVTVTSDGPDTGAEVVIRLPVQHVPVAARPDSGHENPIVARLLDNTR